MRRIHEAYDSYSEEDTLGIARRIAKDASAGDVFALMGDLAAGKTVFARGFALGLGVDELVNSPTYTIVAEHMGGRMPFYHFDVYRIGDADEMIDVGFDEYIYGDGVSLIEWADIIEDILPERYMRVAITKDLDKGLDYRRIVIDYVGSEIIKA